MCAGYGGIGLGLKNIFGDRMRTLAYCELEGFAQANLISKMEKGLMDVAPLWNDLKTFPYESFHGLVDILVAGYPCQPFSAAGKRAGKEDPRHLWPWIADGIRLLQPRMCFFENVEGHISLGLREVIGELEQMGYKVSWGIFSAREVGAPHQRKRVFIMAHLKCEGLERLYKWYTPSEQTQLVGADSGASCQRSEWPSRPGEAQHGWEPPRVVGNAKCVLLPTAGEHGAMDEASGIPADGEGSEPSQADSDASLARSGEAMGNANRPRPQERQGQRAAGIQGTHANGREIAERQTEPPLGGDADGPADRLDYAELCVSGDNRTDELRLLGNGVVPATAERAFRTLLNELNT